jgi:phosphatidylinositol-4,5-bisphosphate 3-kinase
MSTWYDGGLLEIVLDSVTTAEIHMQYGGKYSGSFDKSTFSKFIAEHNLGQKEYQAAVDRFIKSAAAYCVATYVMGIGDRHNDNIMVKTNGQYFHIDFGHFLGNVKYQFGIKRERTEFVFTPEMAEVMGGTKAEGFKDFKQECADALHILRDNVSTLINLFLLMVPAGMPELASAEDINYLRDQLDTRIAKQEATDRFEKQLSLALGDVVKKIDNAMHIIKHN